MIVDAGQFDRFVEILPELGSDEVYFVSLSARKKYLSEEEREKYDLGRTEMFARQVARSKDQLYHVMRKLEGILDQRTTRTGYSMPRHSVVVYANINPTSTVKATNKFVNDINKAREQVMNATLKGSDPDFGAFRYADRTFMNCLQKSTGNRHFLDIDVDTNDESYVMALIDMLGDIEHYVIQTKGGYHVMVVRETLNRSDIRLHEVVRSLDNSITDGEVIFNKNAMVPVCGTLQGNELVTFYN